MSCSIELVLDCFTDSRSALDGGVGGLSGVPGIPGVLGALKGTGLRPGTLLGAASRLGKMFIWLPSLDRLEPESATAAVTTGGDPSSTSLQSATTIKASCPKLVSMCSTASCGLGVSKSTGTLEVGPCGVGGVSRPTRTRLPDEPEAEGNTWTTPPPNLVPRKNLLRLEKSAVPPDVSGPQSRDPFARFRRRMRNSSAMRRPNKRTHTTGTMMNISSPFEEEDEEDPTESRSSC